MLAEPALLAERDTLRARLLGLSARQYDAILREPAQARNVIEDLERTRAELERAEQRIAQWTVRSKATGRLVLAKADCRGEGEPRPVRDLVDEAIEEALRQRTRVVMVPRQGDADLVDGLAATLRFR